MTILYLIIIFIFVVILFFLKNISRLNRNKSSINRRENIKFNKRNIDEWMNLTKKERYIISKKESISYLKNRKVLLEEIRKEYKRVKKN